MALAIYSKPDVTTKLSASGATAPFTVTFDGRSGGALSRKLYIRNDESTKWYDNIIVQPIDSGSPSIIDSTTDGYSWKLFYGDDNPPTEQWIRITAANQIQLNTRIGDPELPGDIVTYLPFWIRVSVPRNQAVTTITRVVLRVTATEHLI